MTHMSSAVENSDGWCEIPSLQRIKIIAEGQCFAVCTLPVSLSASCYDFGIWILCQACPLTSRAPLR